MTMTRTDFELLAQSIRFARYHAWERDLRDDILEDREETINSVMRQLQQVCRRSNRAFDGDKFAEACRLPWLINLAAAGCLPDSDEYPMRFDSLRELDDGLLYELENLEVGPHVDIGKVHAEAMEEVRTETTWGINLSDLGYSEHSTYNLTIEREKPARI